jgi:hypothetical protein
MAEGTKEGTEEKTGTEGGAPPPKADPPAAKAAPPKEEPAKGKASEESKDKGGEPKKTEARQISDEDDIPEDADLLQLSKTALNKRLARHTKKELRERFGTDDFDKIKADLDELTTLRADNEKRRRAEMTELEKAKEDAAAAKAEKAEAEKKYQQAIDSQAFAEYDREAEGALSGAVAPKHMKRALRELKEHVASMDEAELKNPKKVFSSWAKKFVEENPEFAVKAEEPKKIPLNTGSKPTKPEKGQPDLAHKTPTPGKVNSMTKSEYLQYKRERGLA